MEAFIEHGELGLILEDESFEDNEHGLDLGSLAYSSPTKDPFTVGAVHPDYPGMYIRSQKPKRDGNRWDVSVSLEGFLNGTGKQSAGFPKETESQNDWDAVEDEWLTTNRTLFKKGAVGTYGGKTVCVRASREKVRAGVYRVRGSFAGLLDGARRHVTREVTCNGQSLSVESGVCLLPGGWSTPQKSQFDLAKIVVVDTYLQTTPPRTGSVPGTLAPADAPPVQFIDFSTGSPVYHWPNGWKFTTSGSQPFGGRISLWRVADVHEYQLRITPG